MIRPRTIIHQDLCLGKLVPSPHKRTKFSNWIYWTLRSRDKGICQKNPISYSLGEITGLVYISPSHWDLECQGVMIPGTPEQGHLWVYWLHPSDLCKALWVYYISSSFQWFPFKLFQNASHTPSCIVYVTACYKSSCSFLYLLKFILEIFTSCMNAQARLSTQIYQPYSDSML